MAVRNPLIIKPAISRSIYGAFTNSSLLTRLRKTNSNNVDEYVGCTVRRFQKFTDVVDNAGKKHEDQYKLIR